MKVTSKLAASVRAAAGLVAAATLTISTTTLAQPPGPAGETFKVVTVAEGLRNPWSMAWLPNGDMLVTERVGTLRIIRGGKLLPTEVPGVRQGGAAAFAVSGGEGERLVVAIEVRASDAGRLRQEVAQAVLNEIGIAADVVAVPFGALPKTSSGKLRRAEARRRFVANELKVLTRERVAEMEIS